MKIKSLILSLFICSSLFAQDFQGLITYELSYELPANMKGMEGALPSSTNMQYRDDVSMSITENPNGGSTIVYTDNEKGETLVLMDTGMDKIAVKSNFKESEEETPEYTKTGEKKKIAGYNCEVVETEVENTIVRVCYTKELPNIRTENTSGLEGFPLEIIVETEQFTRIQRVSSIDEGSIQELKLYVPDDYTLFSQEEWLKKMQSGAAFGM